MEISTGCPSASTLYCIHADRYKTIISCNALLGMSKTAFWFSSFTGTTHKFATYLKYTLICFSKVLILCDSFCFQSVLYWNKKNWNLLNQISHQILNLNFFVFNSKEEQKVLKLKIKKFSCIKALSGSIGIFRVYLWSSIE